MHKPLLKSLDLALTVVWSLQVEQGVELVKQKGCDCIISFGGGSPHDAAKGIAVVVTNRGQLTRLHINSQIGSTLP